MRQNPLVPDSLLLQVDPRDWQGQGCLYEDLTVERMFDRVEAGLRGVGAFGAPLTVQLDAEWGYIPEYRFGRAPRGGYFGYAISERCTRFEFDELTALTP